MIKTTLKLDGFVELEKALSKIENASTKKALGKRVLLKAGEPLADAINRRAPKGKTFDLSKSYSASTRLQSRLRRRAALTKSDVEVYVGTDNPAGLQQEFGNVNHPPQPHVRPAWDARKRQVLNDIRVLLQMEIMKTAKRQAKKKARK